MVYGNGCVPSKMDGTEQVFQPCQMNLPRQFSYVGVMPPILNQGNSYKCVCYSLTAFMDWRKNQFEGDNNGGQFSIEALWDTRADKNANGMQIKEALKTLRHQGLNGFKINAYALVKTPLALRQALVMNGPCACGLPMYSSNPDFWNGNRFMGGHCVLVVGYNEQGFIIRNSWGTNFAQQGYTFLPENEFGKIFECWTAI